MPAKHNNIYLVGYRCTGKTTVGRTLAGRLNRVFYDLDTDITASEQRSIAKIVADRGWPYFRRLEEKCLRDLPRQASIVAATGGGIVLNPANIDRMQNSGTVIWLTARPETILARLSQDPATGDSRPALTRQAIDREIITTLEARQDLYSQAADLIVATDDDGPDEIVEKILSLL